jgi:hypothetical protein
MFCAPLNELPDIFRYQDFTRPICFPAPCSEFPGLRPSSNLLMLRVLRVDCRCYSEGSTFADDRARPNRVNVLPAVSSDTLYINSSYFGEDVTEEATTFQPRFGLRSRAFGALSLRDRLPLVPFRSMSESLPLL